MKTLTLPWRGYARRSWALLFFCCWISGLGAVIRVRIGSELLAGSSCIAGRFLFLMPSLSATSVICFLCFFLSCLVILYVQPFFLYPKVLSLFFYFFFLLFLMVLCLWLQSLSFLKCVLLILFIIHLLSLQSSPLSSSGFAGFSLYIRLQNSGAVYNSACGAFNIQSLLAQLAFSLLSNSFSPPFSHSLSSLIFGSSSNSAVLNLPNAVTP